MSPSSPNDEARRLGIEALRRIGSHFYRRGWSDATSSNYSILLQESPTRLLITASGKSKGALEEKDFVVVDEQGRAVEEGAPRPSAETLLHTTLAVRPGVGAVLHTHSPWGTVLSDLHRERGFIRFRGYEMLKGLSGVTTHHDEVSVEILDNTQDMEKLSRSLKARLDDPVYPMRYGFLIHQHGLYTWGTDLDEALRHVEVFEFLFDVAGRRLSCGLDRPDL